MAVFTLTTKIKALLTGNGLKKANKESKEFKNNLKQADQHAKNTQATLSKTKTGKSLLGRFGMEREGGAPAGTGGKAAYGMSRGVIGGRGGSGRNFAGLAGGLGADSGGSFVGAYASIAANLFAITAAFQALSQAAQTEQLTQGLELMGARGGVALKQVARDLRDVTDNAIPMATAMKAVAQTSSAGFGATEIERLGGVAKGASLALGRDMGESMDRLTRGAIKLEPELLDELGIMVRLDEAVKQYALENNKAASALTLTERRQAFLNAVLEEGERKFGDISDQIDPNPYNQLAAAVSDAGVELGKFLNMFLGPAAKIAANNPITLLVPGIFLAMKALQGLVGQAQVTATDFAKAFDKSKNAVTKWSTTTEGAIRDADDVIMAQTATSVKSMKHFDARLEKNIQTLDRHVKATSDSGKGLSKQEKASIRARAASLKHSAAMRAQRAATLQLVKSLAIQAGIMIGITIAVAAASMAFNKFFGKSEEIKKMEERLKALSEQAQETGKQLQNMLQPGRNLEAEAFDAITTSAKNAVEAIQEVQRAQANSVSGNEMIGTGKDNRYTEVASQVEKEFEQSMKARMGFRRGEEKVLMDNLKLITTTMSKEEQIALLQQMKRSNEMDLLTSTNEERKAAVQEMINMVYAASAINARFSEMKQVTQDINKNIKGLFPPEKENQIKNLADNFQSIANFLQAGPPSDSPLNATYLQGIGGTFGSILKNANAIAGAVQLTTEEETSLRGILKEQKDLEEARNALKVAELSGDATAIQNAQVLVQQAQEELGLIIDQNEELFRRLSRELEIIAIREDILNLSKDTLTSDLKVLKTQQQIASILTKVRRDQAETRLSGIAPIKIPQEATLEYQAKVAEEQYNAVLAQAEVRKSIIDAEYLLEEYKLDNLRRTEEFKRDELIAGLADTGVTQATLEGQIFNNPGMENQQLRSYSEILQLLEVVDSVEEQRAIKAAYFVAVLEQQSSNLETSRDLSRSLVDAETSRARQAMLRAKAEKDAYNSAAAGAIRQTQLNIKNISHLQKMRDLALETNAALTGNVDAGAEFAAMMDAALLPGINEQISLNDQLQLQLVAQYNAIRDTDDDANALRESIQGQIQDLKEANDVLDEQRNKINDIINAYSNPDSLLSRQKNLEMLREEVDLMKQLASSQQDLRDSRAELARSQIQRRARDENRELSGTEELRIEAIAAQAKLENAIEERNILIAEYAIKKENFALEREMLLLSMENQIALAKQLDPNADTTGAQALADRARERTPQMEAMMDSAFANALSAAENRIRTIINDSSDILNVPADAIQMYADTLAAGGNVDPAALQNFINTATNLFQNAIPGATAAIGGLGGGLGGDATRTPEEIYQQQSQAILDRGGRGARTGFGLAQASFMPNVLGYGEEFNALMEETAALTTGGMAALLQDDSAVERIREMAKEMGALNKQTETLNEISDTVRQGFEDVFTEIITGSGDVGDVVKSVAENVLNSLASMLSQQLTDSAMGLGKSFLGMFGFSFADGGVMEYANGGITKYANGGIAAANTKAGIVKGPTYLVGEGKYNEAVVPLPDGRAIPVQMHNNTAGDSTQNNVVTVNVSVDNSGNTSGSAAQGQDFQNLGGLIAQAVQKELQEQKRPGGILNRYGAA